MPRDSGKDPASHGDESNRVEGETRQIKTSETQRTAFQKRLMGWTPVRISAPEVTTSQELAVDDGGKGKGKANEGEYTDKASKSLLKFREQPKEMKRGILKKPSESLEPCDESNRSEGETRRETQRIAFQESLEGWTPVRKTISAPEVTTSQELAVDDGGKGKGKADEDEYTDKASKSLLKFQEQWEEMKTPSESLESSGKSSSGKRVPFEEGFEKKDSIKDMERRMDRHISDLQYAHFKVTKIYGRIELSLYESEDIINLFEQNETIKVSLNEEWKKLKPFVETMEKINSVLRETMKSAVTRAEEIVEKFDEAKSSSERAKHLSSLIELKESVLGTLGRIKKVEGRVNEVKILKERAEALKSNEQQGSRGDDGQQNREGRLYNEQDAQSQEGRRQEEYSLLQRQLDSIKLQTLLDISNQAYRLQHPLMNEINILIDHVESRNNNTKSKYTNERSIEALRQIKIASRKPLLTALNDELLEIEIKSKVPDCKSVLDKTLRDLSDLHQKIKPLLEENIDDKIDRDINKIRKRSEIAFNNIRRWKNVKPSYELYLKQPKAALDMLKELEKFASELEQSKQQESHGEAG